MIIPSFHRLFIAALSLAVAGGTGCAKIKSAPDRPGADQVAAAPGAGVGTHSTAETWAAIQHYTFDQRADFSASLDRMARACESDVANVKTRMNQSPEAPRAQQQRLLQDFGVARAELRMQVAELRVCSPETWAEAKAKTAATWERMQGYLHALTAGEKP